LIAAFLFSATYAIGLAAEPLEGVHAALNGEFSEQAQQPENGALLHAGYAQESLHEPPMPAQRFPASGWHDSEPAGPSTIQGKAAGGWLGLKDAVLASHAVRPLKRVEIGLGLSNDPLVNGYNGWYGVYLRSLDRVAERNTIYGVLRETPHPGLNYSKAPPAICCQHSDTPTSLQQYANAITAVEVSPTFFLFGMVPKRSWKFNLEDGWTLRAGTRHLQYNSAPRTRVDFLGVERYWDSLRTSYSYQVERVSGGGLAPSHVLQFDYFYSRHDSIGFSFANGREVADFGPLGIQNTEVSSATFRGQHWFKQDWALTFQAGYNDHGSMPAQAGARIGLRHSF